MQTSDTAHTSKFYSTITQNTSKNSLTPYYNSTANSSTTNTPAQMKKRVINIADFYLINTIASPFLRRYNNKMSDFNMVNVESQSQIGKSVDTTKMHMLSLDLKDFNQFLPVIKELQITSSKILKDLQPFLAKRDKRTVSLPYNMLRKF